MQLGKFSVSLTVKDLHTSKAFYEKLGFREVGVHQRHGRPGDGCPNVVVVEKLL